MGMPDVPDWHVVGAGIREENELAPHGAGIRLVHVVPYVIDSGPAKGHHGVVRVEPHDYTPAGVEEAINTAVSRTHGVSDLRRNGA